MLLTNIYDIFILKYLHSSLKLGHVILTLSSTKETLKKLCVIMVTLGKGKEWFLPQKWVTHTSQEMTKCLNINKYCSMNVLENINTCWPRWFSRMESVALCQGAVMELALLLNTGGPYPRYPDSLFGEEIVQMLKCHDSSLSLCFDIYLIYIYWNPPSSNVILNISLHLTSGEEKITMIALHLNCSNLELGDWFRLVFFA